MNRIFISLKDQLRRFSREGSLRRLLLYAVYLFLVLVLQTMVCNQIRIFGICAFVLPAAAVAVGMFEGAVCGVVFGLILGIAADMFFVESTVLFTILFPLLAFGTGFVSQFFINRRFVPYIITALAAIVITGIFQGLRVIVTDTFSLRILSTILLQAFFSLPAAALLYLPPARWIN